MLHTMLDAAGIVLRMHYKSMNCDVLFSQGSVRTIFKRGRHFSYISKKFIPLYNSAKIIKNRSRFSKVMITNVLWFTVYIAPQLTAQLYVVVSLVQQE